MNERIKELYGKALDKAVPYTWHNLDHVEVEKVMKEFAELIVKECARVYWNIDNGETHTEYVEALKKHFGVEE
jgi:hypothetical protein